MGQRPKGPLYFPVTERKDLKGHSGFVAVENALPGFGNAFLKEIRPENGATEHLWEFYKLQRDQKHNDFVPLVTLASVKNLNATIGANRFIDCAVGGSADRTITMFDSNVPIKATGTPQAFVEIRFAKGTVFDGELVVPTLENVHKEVSRTIEWLDNFASKTKAA